ncbi:MAG TPA: hypothetical protein VFP34_14285, partial [Microlunatus sp.]|nr:hypothetical protein [Microlunatus sp.]
PHQPIARHQRQTRSHLHDKAFHSPATPYSAPPTLRLGHGRARYAVQRRRPHFLVHEAHRHGLQVTAHTYSLPAVEQALAAGVDGLEHASC